MKWDQMTLQYNTQVGILEKTTYCKMYVGHIDEC